MCFFYKFVLNDDVSKDFCIFMVIRRSENSINILYYEEVNFNFI